MFHISDLCVSSHQDSSNLSVESRKQLFVFTQHLSWGLLQQRFSVCSRGRWVCDSLWLIARQSWTRVLPVKSPPHTAPSETCRSRLTSKDPEISNEYRTDMNHPPPRYQNKCIDNRYFPHLSEAFINLKHQPHYRQYYCFKGENTWSWSAEFEVSLSVQKVRWVHSQRR